MTDAMTESLPPYNLLVSGLVSTDTPWPLMQTLLFQIMSDLGSNDVELRSLGVRRRDDESEALLELDIGEDNVGDFCDQFMQPQTFPKLRKVSEYGLLGFQPIEGTDLAEHWHRAVFKSTFVYGSQRMKEFRVRALGLRDFKAIPMWFRVANFVADTAIEASLVVSIKPSNIVACLEERSIRLAQKSSAIDEAQSKAALLMKWAKRSGNPITLSDPITRNTYDNFFLKIRQICSTLEMAQNRQTPGLSMVQQRNLFLDLYAFTEEAYKTFSATEEGMRIYMLEMWFSGAKAVTGFGLLGNFCWQAYWRQSVWSMWGIPASLLWLANSVRTGYNAQKKEDQCRQLAHLIWQTWHAADETSRFLKWIHTTNNEVAFVGQSGRIKWEAYLMEKAGGKIQENWKSAAKLQTYMKERLGELKAVEEEMRSTSEIIFS